MAGTGVDGDQGDGQTATATDLNHPTGVMVDPGGNLFIAEAYNDRIRRVDATTGIVTTVGGPGDYGELVEGGPATSAFLGLTEVVGLALDPEKQTLFYSDSFFSTVRVINLVDGTISTRVGGGTPMDGVGDGLDALEAHIDGPVGLLFRDGDLYIAEFGGNRIRRVKGDDRTIETVAGTGVEGFAGDGGPATAAQLAEPTGLAFDLDGNLLIAERANYRVRRVDLVTGMISTIAGDGAFAPISEGSLATETSFSDPIALAVDGAGNLFIADSGLLQVFRVDSRTQRVTFLAGNGQLNSVRDGNAAAASFNGPEDVTASPSGDLYIADSGNLLIRKLDAQNIVTTIAGGGDAEDDLGDGFAGDGGPALEAHFYESRGLALDTQGNLFIADTGNHRIRAVRGPIP